MYLFRAHVEASGWSCDLRDPEDLPDAAAVTAAVASCDVVLGLHLYRSGLVLAACRALKVPYVACCGGTDVNECLQVPAMNAVMQEAVAGAVSLLAFTADMKEAALAAWPFLQPERVRVLPQAVSVCPDDAFDVAHFLKSLDGDQAKQAETVSESFYEIRERGLVPGQTSVPFNGPSSTITQGVPRTQSRMPRDVGYPLIVLIAGLRPVKDVLYVAEAWSNWNAEREGRGRLLIMGPALDAHYARQVHSEASRWCGVRVADSLKPPECHAVIASATVLLNSSLSEGMSAAVLEAMALGTPVLARDIPGNRAVVRHGETGMLFSCPDTFVQQLNRLLDEPALVAAVTANAKAYVAARHHPREEAATLSIVLREAAVRRQNADWQEELV
ncbi:glycosyltransferase 1 domain-containing protein 1-like isoform X2 [Penaeus chinensis]|uniref:glycosyltransferase 1 domain-containing protein 1-like isoform X2 n=1 Tax=Penaeus chinensis TaxID=139456 RepID=UPI001FB773E6|nr:glycosyltransferase 1 domain-containing protein 1-like isoform X2 [Penaeus chinensis]